MKVSFEVPVCGLDGSPLKANEETVTLGKILSRSLAELKGDGNSVKLWGWATNLYRGEALDLDDQDQELLKECLKQTQLNVAAVAQILKVMSDAKESAKPKLKAKES